MLSAGRSFNVSMSIIGPVSKKGCDRRDSPGESFFSEWFLLHRTPHFLA